jgi:hypothetical protein
LESLRLVPIIQDMSTAAITTTQENLSEAILNHGGLANAIASHEPNEWQGVDYDLKDGRVLRFTLDDGTVNFYVFRGRVSMLLLAETRFSGTMEPKFLAGMLRSMERGVKR